MKTWDTRVPHNAKKPRPSRSLRAVYERAPASSPWSSGITAMSLMARPGDCMCSWSPVWTWEGKPEPGGFQASGGFALKFANRSCPYLRHSRPA